MSAASTTAFEAWALDLALWHSRFPLVRLVCRDREAMRDLWRWFSPEVGGA